MGAPLREWILRVAIAIAVVTFGVGVATWSAPWQGRVLLAVIAALALGDQAFRRIPAFDLFGRVRSRLPPSAHARWCAVTFDDGPSAATARVLDILADERVPATFFVLGGSVARHPSLVTRAHAEGHAIGLHGMDHRKLATADEASVAAQVDGLTARLHELGVTPVPLYRTPHGEKSASVFAVARRRGLTLWAWTRGVWDTDRPAPGVLVRRATRGATSGMVLLLHDGRGDEPDPDVSSMVSALPSILRELKRREFSFVRLSDVPGR